MRTIVYIVYGEVATRPHLGGGPLVMKYDTACKVIQHGFYRLGVCLVFLNLLPGSHEVWFRGFFLFVSFLVSGPFVWGWDDDVPLSACAFIILAIADFGISSLVGL